MSASSEARISSRLTSGSVFESGIVNPGLATGALAVPGIELDEHVLEAGARAQQRRGVGVDQVLVLLIDLHLHDRGPVLQRDVADLADLDPGDPDRLALSGRDRLRRSRTPRSS